MTHPRATTPITNLPITLERDAATPLAVQLAETIRTAAADGVLRAGDRLPSTRALAAELGVSRTVTAAAYDQLHAEGWIDGKHGSGTYVTTTPPRGIPHGRVSGQGKGEREYIDLAPGAPLIEDMDRAAWRRAWRAAADEEPLLRPVRAGLPEYREVIAEHLLRHRGLSVAPARIAEVVLATAGTTAAVNELACAVFEPGDVLAMEDPGYQRAVQVLRSAGVRVVPVPVDEGGVRVDEIDPAAKAVYCSPSHQYPLGGRMAASRRVQLVERARERGWLVIEDDYDGELRYDVAPLPLLASLAPDVVVHLGTTSKIFTSTLGAGWMIAPQQVTGKVLDYRERTGVAPAAAGQQVLVQLARNGDLGRHLRKIRRVLHQRRELVVHTLRAAGADVLGDDAGAHVVVPLENPLHEDAVVRGAREQGIWIDGLARHHIGTQQWHGVALGYTACTHAELEQALPVVAGLLKRCGYAGSPGGRGH
ncbi:PLP-dependent aminotransferase family protein [Sciscionella sediminilitoris]|uniref:MocR-like pyridoxine biosynthesis transcription factor PdxR n=1 Tax=Sciscionella sediminilitoris TaxID=1445613 RepID=UPI0004DF8963|nr:PLP-dependent aminotransferase family protein [Sciscionella sp. SE31]